MDMNQARADFERDKKVYDSALLSFQDVEGWDVYNCSIPFAWQGKTYIYGRVERREVWAGSKVCLFEQTGPDAYRLVEKAPQLQLEDPFVQKIGDEIVLGGTHVRKKSGKIDTYYGYFYRGTDLFDLQYFTTGPDYMKDIRLVPMADGRVGVFSRPRSEAVKQKYGSESIIGFAVMENLDGLTTKITKKEIPKGFEDQERSSSKRSCC